MSEPISIFGFPVVVSETMGRDEFWMASERAARAIKDYDEGRISKDDRDAILGEEMLERRTAFGRL